MQLIKATALTLVLGLSACANVDYTVMEGDQARVSEVVEMPGVSQDDLYEKATQFVVKTYNNPEVVTKYKEKSQGKIMGEAIAQISPETTTFGLLMPYRYEFTIDVKDGKARIVFDGYRSNDKSWTLKHAYEVRPMNARMKQLADEFRVFMQQESGNAVNSDW